jgi:hypothetical protein
MRAMVGADHAGYGDDMTADHHGSDRVGHGEASLGDAQSSNPPDDPDMLTPDAPLLDTDVEFEGDFPPPPEERGNDDPAPNMP